jgi:hypothetical protein
MKNTTLSVLVCLSCSSAVLTYATSDQLVAGWDFSQYALSGANSIDGATFVGKVDANYSDLVTPSAGIAAGAYGTLFYNGEFSSSVTNYESFESPVVAPTTGDLSSASLQTGDSYPMSDSSTYGVLKSSGQQFAQPFSFRAIDNVSLVFMAVANQPSGNWYIQFAALAENSPTAQINWEYSSDGVVYTGAGSTEIGESDTEYQIPFSGLSGTDTAYIRASIDNVFGGTLKLDNVGIHAGTSRVEPGSWWSGIEEVDGWKDSSLAGGVGIGWIVDSNWPLVYSDVLGENGAAWIEIHTNGSIEAFYAYNLTSDHWMYIVPSVGWYYSYESGASGWFSIY